MNRIVFRLLAALFVFAAPVLAQTSASDWSNAAPVTITMTNYAFAPAQVILQHGVAYRLRFVNASGKDHNFSAPEFFAAATIAPADKSKIDDGAVDVDSRQSVEIELIPTLAGRYDVKCTHFMHAMLGMTGKVIVR